MIKVQFAKKLLSIKRVIYIFIVITCFFSSKIVTAEPKNSERLCQIPKSDRNKVITQETISETGLTIPSLWWRKQLLDPEGEIIINWQAHTDLKVVYLTVNRKQWNSLDYIQRYKIVNNFGTVARQYQYNLGIISDRKICLATYNCDFSLKPNRCQINFKPFNQSLLER